MTEVIPVGLNLGQRYVKASYSSASGRRDITPFPAVIAPWNKSDTNDFVKRAADLVATVDRAVYIGGEIADRLPMANRQQDQGRLEPNSPMYRALSQMAIQAMGITRSGAKPKVLIATAIPVAWKLNIKDSEELVKQHIRAGLKGIVEIADILVASEPNAMVASELMDDNGKQVPGKSNLRDVLCVGDIGGGTVNRTILDGLRALPGQAVSPVNGSSAVVLDLIQRADMQYIDAERRLEKAVKMPGFDPLADTLLRQYREKVIGDFQRAWAEYRHAQKLFGGGTVHWVKDDLVKAFGALCQIVEKPQLAIAIGLWRMAKRKVG